ncbi:MAG: protein kinase, partial [Myxococcota bacterium]
MGGSLVRAERVTLLREVSEGPLAALFAGERHTGDDVQLVAVKVLRVRRSRELTQLGRLRDLGRRLNRLGHRNLSAPTELAVVEGRPALLSPWIEGIDLLDWAEVLRETDTVLPTRAVCEVLKSAAAALDAAMFRTAWGEAEPLAVMHRDVKPSNLMITRDGEVKLLDFSTGLTSLGGRDGRGVAIRAGLGRYLSPGRRRGKRGGPSSDVYALGLIGIELFSRRWLQRVRDTNPAHDRHLAELVANLPDLGLRAGPDDRALRSLLLRMVAFDADARPPAAEVAHTMRTLADRAPGPSLEAFAHDHAFPTLPVPDEPHERLAEGALVEPEHLTSLLAAEVEEESPEPSELELDPPQDDNEDEDEDEVALADREISITRIVRSSAPSLPP